MMVSHIWLERYYGCIEPNNVSYLSQILRAKLNSKILIRKADMMSLFG